MSVSGVSACAVYTCTHIVVYTCDMWYKCCRVGRTKAYISC